MFPIASPAGAFSVLGGINFSGPGARLGTWGLAVGGYTGDMRTLFRSMHPNQNTVFGCAPNGSAAVAAIQVYSTDNLGVTGTGYRYGDIRATPGSITISSLALGPGGAGAAPVCWPLRFNVNGLLHVIGIDGSWSFNGGQTTLDAGGNFGLGQNVTARLYLGHGSAIEFDRPDNGNQFRNGYFNNDLLLCWNFNAGPTLMALDNGGSLYVQNCAVASNISVGSFAAHGVVIGNNPVSTVAPGTAGQVLTSNGPSADPTFQTPAPGAMVRLQQVVCAGSQNVVNFTPPAGYSSLLIMYQARDTTAGSSDSNIFIRFNADATAANYDTPEAIADTGTTLARASPAVSANGFAIITIPNNGSLTNRAGIGRIEIPNYTGAFWKQALGVSSESLGTNAAPLGSINLRHGEWRSTAPITSIDLIAATAFLNNSVFTLYGLL